MRKSFEEMMEIVDMLQEKLAQFIERAPNLSFQDTCIEITKCNEFADKMDIKLKEMTPSKTDSVNYCSDLAANLMCRYVLLMYEDTVLIAHTSNLKKGFINTIKFIKSKKKKHVNKFAKS